MSEESDAGVAGKPDNWWVRRDAAIFSALWVAFGLWLPLAASMVWKIGFLARYALPVAVPLTAVGIYYLRKRHVVLLTGVLLVVVGWNVPKAVRHQNAQEGVRELVGRLKSHAEAGEPIVVVNWAAYTADFHSPELEGMKYYGFDVAGRGVQSVGVERLSGKIVLDSSQVLPLSRAWVVCYAEASGPLRQFLADRERAYQVTRFGTVELYQLSSDRQWTEGS